MRKTIRRFGIAFGAVAIGAAAWALTSGAAVIEAVRYNP